MAQSRGVWGYESQHPLQRAVKVEETSPCFSAGRKNKVGRERLKTRERTDATGGLRERIEV